MTFPTFGSGAVCVPGWTRTLLLKNKKSLIFFMRVSTLCLIMLLTFIQLIKATETSAQKLQDVTISLSLKDDNLQQAFKKIEKLTSFRFAYKKSTLNLNRKYNQDIIRKPVDQVLNILLAGTDLRYDQSDYIIVVKENPLKLMEQPVRKPVADTNIIVRGRVTGADGQPIGGAVITVKGTSIGTASAASGNFELRDVPLNATVVVSHVGYFNNETKVTAATGLLLIKLEEGKNTMNEVTVVSTGYQTLPRERSTGSFGVITAAELEKIPSANLIQRIEGLVTGLQPKLMAGDNSFLYQGLVQGINSDTRTVGNNDYDVNVRGNTTIVGEKMPLIVVDGFPSNMDIKTLNPSDIEQITVLKDAAAASIWGVRAANGVIVIDTKKGRERLTPSINFTTSYTTYGKPRFDYLPLANSADIINWDEEVINKNLNLYNPLTAAPALRFYKSDAAELVYRLRAGQLDSAAYKSARAQLSAINGYDQYQRYLLQNANAQNYNLSVSGGSGPHTYFFSASYAKEIPSAVGTKGDRFTITANQSFKLLKKATLDVGLRAALFNYQTNGIGMSGVRNGSSSYLPFNRIFDDNGQKIYYSQNYFRERTTQLQNQYGYLPWGYNWLDEITNSDRTLKDNIYTGNIGLTIPIAKGFSVSGQFMMEKSYQDQRTWNSPESYYTRNIVNTATSINTTNNTLVFGIPRGGILSESFSNNTNYSGRAQLLYNKNIGGIHQVNAVGGAEIRETRASQTIPPAIYGYNMQRGIGQSISSNYVDVNGMTVSTPFISSTQQQDKTRRFLSYYTNAAYTLMGKYSLSGSVRYDDYNNFGVDRKYRATPLWSAGIKWDISREQFLQPVDWINSLSFRSTYGYNGNIAQNIYPFTNISLSSSSQTGLPTASIISPANPTLRWEKTGVFNMGLDYSILNNRISGTFEYFTKKGRDLFFQFPIDPTYGVNTLLTNNTSINARGFEAAISGRIIDKKDVSWIATFNFSYNRNKIVDTRFMPTASTYSSLSGTNISGYPTGSLWVYRYAGLDANGMTLVYDTDKQTKLAPNQNPKGLEALYYAGTTTAPYYGSLTQTVRVKRFTLFAIGTYSFGSVFLRPTTSVVPSTRQPYVLYDLNKDIALRWRNPGDENFTTVPGIAGAFAATSMFRYGFSDINVESGSYIRLREVSLQYDLPVSIARKVTAKMINVNLAVRNPGLLWTKNKEGYDPDFIPMLSSNTVALPPSASYTFTLNINF